MLKRIHTFLIQNIDSREYMLVQKAHVLINFSLIISLSIPFIIAVYTFMGRFTLFMSLALVTLLVIVILLQVLLYRGHLLVYTHMLLSFFFLTVWLIIFSDSGKPLVSRIDTVIYSFVILMMTPMAIFKKKWVIFIYYCSNIIILNIYAYYLYLTYNFSMYIYRGLLLDSNVALILMSLVSYNIFSIYFNALQRTQSLEAETSMRNIELLNTNEELGRLNRMLSASGNELKESEERYRLLYQEAPVGMSTIRLSDGLATRCNGTWQSLLGCDSESKEKSFYDFFQASEDGKIFLSELQKNGEITDKEVRLKGPEENIFWGAVTARIYPDQLKAEIVLIDISRRKIAEEYIHQLTFFDSLTGLPNKKMLVEKIFSEIQKTRRQSHSNILGLVSINIEGYRNFIDIHGSSDGNRLLRRISRKFKDIFREDDMVARYGVDKFMILLSDVNSVEDIKTIIDNIFHAFEASMVIGTIPVKISLNCGVSIYPNDGENPEQLIKNSELALFSARQEGRNTYQLFDADLNEKLLNEILIEEELQLAIEENHLSSYYQPRVLADGEVVSAESLIRWFSPSHGLIMPDRFIPIAEKTGMIKEIGKKIFRQSCLQLKEWSKQADRPFSISVNVSPVELNAHDFITSLKEIIHETGVDPGSLEIEVTEQSLMFNQEETIKKLEEIHYLGVKIAIDDFGTGYSSLSTLKDMPIDTIKIDKSFIENIPADQKSVTIIVAVINLAKSLGFSVVVEGIETGEQLEFLNSLKIDEFQGYYFSRPLAPEDFYEKYFKGRKK